MSNILELDLLDLQNLLGLATRDNSKQVLSAAIEAVRLKIATTPASVQKQAEEEVKFTDYAFTSITDYGWENKDKDTVKVYLMKGLDGIKNLGKDKIQCDFDSHSVDLKIRDFNGKNLRFRVDPLFESIAVEKCTISVKSNSITLTLAKQNQKNWTSLKWQKAPEKKSQSESKKDPLTDESDPSASLMSLMKDLYQNGDENMKRTIAESWEKS